MPGIDGLDHDIAGLQRLLTVVWKDLANPSITRFERREAINQMKLCSAQLRRALDAAEAERIRKREARKQPEGTTFAASASNYGPRARTQAPPVHL
ncbi:hypothetical protein [Rhodopseudomonas sp. RCAM05734]|uniref:hypothetical protein n=1 Tax=Rhodopseudomonas sp. RCAM05734 TaxID=3457549 RepID=UPI004043D518